MQTLTFTSCQLPVSSKLHELLNKQLQDRIDSPKVSSFVLNFRDENYSAEDGGFHPVEIMIEKNQDETWRFIYITDFAYFGNYYPELERNLDFSFSNDEFFVAHMGWFSMQDKKSEAKEIYEMWETSFLAYADMNVYEIEVTTEELDSE